MVKGNPKGLMRLRVLKEKELFLWFFTTSIGKHTYSNQCCDSDGEQQVNFDKEGAFEKWKKSNKRCYLIDRYVLDGDQLTIGFGHSIALEKVMETHQIKRDRKFPQGLNPYKTPPGWFAKYLEKNGPGRLFMEGWFTLGRLKD